VESNVIVVGESPAEVDAVCARLMGFEPRKIPLVRHAFDPHRWPLADRALDEVTAFDERVGNEIALDEIKPALGRPFKPHFGWIGHIEADH
jgi:uncharacterized protein (DUF362 family)